MTADSPDTPALKAELPEELFWLEQDLRALHRHVAIARVSERVVAPGATRRDGIDLPADAGWANGCTPESFYIHHEDGASFCLQLNLEDVPAVVRRPGWPAHGVLWVFMERSDWRYEVTVQFDPRPAATIPWRHRAPARTKGVSWEVGLSLPWATPETLPVLANWREVGDVYDEWMQQHYLLNRNRGLVLGGYAFTNQGDHDEDNKEFVLAIEDMYFGDCGEVYVFFNPERGFYGRADIC